MKNFILLQKKLYDEGKNINIEKLKIVAEKYLLPSEYKEIFGKEN